VLLDAGANAECSPAMLVQFAQMGSVFARERFGIDQPRVGLLSIGEEDSKGTPLVKETNALLSAGVGIDFVGNVEGRDVVSDRVDVVVTDGFTGNVVLKSLEGVVKILFEAILGAFTSTEATQEASRVLLPALGSLIHDLDPDAIGGAMLLGVDGVCIISHGSSSARAIANALAVARDMVDHDVVGHLRSAIGG
jgi:phosphate acyltransferase